ncbi:hypothetical protein [Rhizobium sp. BR 315]|uniref:hypothetical protein n=1 Tax=Rhizobium sp. BR 315 TaxID=3040014 RepID=UPI003D329752
MSGSALNENTGQSRVELDSSAQKSQLAGNHFIAVTSNLDKLPELGGLTLWKGARKIRFKTIEGRNTRAPRF